MIYFSSLPDPLLSIGGPLPVTLAGMTASPAELRILTDDGTLLATKRIVDQTEATIDIAPLVRRVVHYTPTGGATGLFAATDRLVRMRLEASCDGQLITTTTRAYFASDEAVTAPARCTTRPEKRFLASDEWDELTLLTDAPTTITVTAEGRNGTTTERYDSYLNGVVLFRLAAADFPEAAYIKVDCGDYGCFTYTILQSYGTEAVRLAWRNPMGGIDHYTFPTLARKEWIVRKERAADGEGVQLASIEREERWQLRSAHELPEHCATLAELLAAEEVWRVTGTDYTRVDLLTETASIEQQSGQQQLTVTIRPTIKTTRL